MLRLLSEPGLRTVSVIQGHERARRSLSALLVQQLFRVSAPGPCGRRRDILESARTRESLAGDVRVFGMYDCSEMTHISLAAVGPS